MSNQILKFNSVLIFISSLLPQDKKTENYIYNGKLAIFDMDGTLITPRASPFPKSYDDMKVVHDSYNNLQKLVEEGYTIVVVSNQAKRKGFSTEKHEEFIVDRVKYFAKIFDLPFVLYAALEHDEYRKPEIGIWENLINYMFEDLKKKDVFYVGDAAGRKGDHSDSDLEWAKNIGIKFYTPEEFFSKK